jgi:hypothetical protein
VKSSYARRASLDGIPLPRCPKDTYDQYFGMTKDAAQHSRWAFYAAVRKEI